MAVFHSALRHALVSTIILILLNQVNAILLLARGNQLILAEEILAATDWDRFCLATRAILYLFQRISLTLCFLNLLQSLLDHIHDVIIREDVLLESLEVLSLAFREGLGEVAG
jgi:hypothetical protein